MALPSALLNTTCDLYRPFSASSPLVTGIPCHLANDLAGGRVPGGSGLTWTHYLLIDESVDVRDGCTRTAGSNTLTYADGDKVIIPSGGSNTRYVVVWVEYVQRGLANAHKRVYLLRDQPTWPGP